MKIFTAITTVLLFSLFANPAFATTGTPAPSPAKSNDPVKEKLDDQINQLKEKIASRVSELNLVERRGIIGTVTEVKGNQITVTDNADNTRFIDVDEITKFSSPGRTGTFGISDITNGTKISVLGIYNKQSKRLLARFVSTYSNSTIQSGVITAVDPKNFQLTVMTPEQKEIKVDVETATKLSSYTAEEGLVKYGFSKLAVGDRVALTGNPAKTDANVLAASRLVTFIGIPKDPRINVGVAGANTASPAATTAAPTTPVTPTPASGRNLAPIR
jgi:hypothetical protein